ncbi:MAG: hypothetical protein ACERKN_07205 [Velocimicrobium sp.]
MKNITEWVDFTHKTTDDLEHKANEKRAKDIQKAKAYCEGYTQACEDFARVMRQEFSQEQG